MAIGAGHAHQVMSGRMQGHRGRILLMARQAQVLPGLLQDLAVRIVARGAVEAVGTANLVRAGDLRQLGHVAVAAEAGIRCHRVEVVRGSAQRRLIRRILEAGQPNCVPVAGCRNFRLVRRRRPRRDVVVRRVAAGAGQAVVSVDRRPPLGARSTRVLLVALQTELGGLGGLQPFEVQDQSRLFAPRLQVPAGRTVAGLAGLASV